MIFYLTTPKDRNLTMPQYIQDYIVDFYFIDNTNTQETYAYWINASDAMDFEAWVLCDDAIIKWRTKDVVPLQIVSSSTRPSSQTS